MKVTRLKSGGFLSSGTDAGDLNILRSAKNIDDGSATGMKAGVSTQPRRKVILPRRALASVLSTSNFMVAPT